MFRCRTNLADGVFSAEQVGPVASTLEEASYLLENENEVLVVHGSEIELLEPDVELEEEVQ